MAKARQAVAASALEEILLNQSAALAQSRQSTARTRQPEQALPEKPEEPALAVASLSEGKPRSKPRSHSQQGKQGTKKPCGEDGGKPAPDDEEILYAKVPGSIMRAMKLHLVFSTDPNVRNVKELLVRTLSNAFAEEIKEVQAREAVR